MCTGTSPVHDRRLTHCAAGSRAQDLERLDQLESLFESIRLAPLSVVDSLVRDIRTEKSGLKKDLVQVGPWEGHEGMFDTSDLVWAEILTRITNPQLTRGTALQSLSFLFASVLGMVVQKATSMIQSLRMMKTASPEVACQ